MADSETDVSLAYALTIRTQLVVSTVQSRFVFRILPLKSLRSQISKLGSPSYDVKDHQVGQIT
jgi:hypothetical protein